MDWESQTCGAHDYDSKRSNDSSNNSTTSGPNNYSNASNDGANDFSNATFNGPCMKEQKRVRHPRKAVLEAIALGLEEIEAHFVLEGFSARNDGPIEEKSPDEESQEESNDDDSKEEDDDEDEDEEYSGSTVCQRE